MQNAKGIHHIKTIIPLGGKPFAKTIDVIFNTLSYITDNPFLL